MRQIDVLGDSMGKRKNLEFHTLIKLQLSRTTVGWLTLIIVPFCL